MFIIVMHNKIEYLNVLNSLARKEGITKTNIIQKEDLSFSLKGHNVDFIFQRGSVLPQYDKAFIAVVSKQESERLFNLMQNSSDLNMRSLNTEGFICKVPFGDIKNLALDSFFAGRGCSEDILSRILKPNRIQLGLTAGSPEEAISVTAKPLEKAGEIIDFPKFINDVLAREGITPTAIGDGIAIPHAHSRAVEKLVISVGRFDRGIDFGAIDNKPVKLLFLIGSPSVKGTELNEYLTTLAELGKHLSNDDFCRTLLGVSTPEDFVKAFQNSKRGLPAKLVRSL